MEVQPIDLTYILDGHGWSSCHFHVGQDTYTYEPTHVFNNPLEEFLNGLIFLLNGEKSVTIKWFDEPGLYLISLNIDDLRHDHVNVKIDTYPDEQSVKPCEAINSLNFVCYLRDLLICIWYQVQKLEKQLERKTFAKSRRYDFPLETVREFEKAYDEKYS